MDIASSAAEAVDSANPSTEQHKSSGQKSPRSFDKKQNNKSRLLSIKHLLTQCNQTESCLWLREAPFIPNRDAHTPTGMNLCCWHTYHPMHKCCWALIDTKCGADNFPDCHNVRAFGLSNRTSHTSLCTNRTVMQNSHYRCILIFFSR